MGHLQRKYTKDQKYKTNGLGTEEMHAQLINIRMLIKLKLIKFILSICCFTISLFFMLNQGKSGDSITDYSTILKIDR